MNTGISLAAIHELQEIVWEYYASSGRHFPWRTPDSDGTFDPYKIVVSELMLQQTQAKRVVPKYELFIETYATVQSLSEAPLSAVLALWSGLGYNRRAKYLQQIANTVVREYGGMFPADKDALTALPGIGSNTAGAICAYSYNQPVTFIETNIRTVFIYHFFQDQDAVSDDMLRPIVTAACDQEHPREWYWALMDYGVHLKATVGNVSRSSSQYIKQSTFKGSRRQIRGRIIQLLITRAYDVSELTKILEDDRAAAVIDELLQEKLITRSDNIVHL